MGRLVSRGWLAAALVSMLPACGGETADARDQWLVTVSTDAPTPQFGDRLLLEVLDADGEAACAGCRRQLGVPELEDWPASFGVVAPEAGRDGLQVRVRLYRTRYAGSDGLPFGELVVDALGELPPASGVTAAHVHLPMDCFGVAANPQQHSTCDAASRQLGEAPVLGAAPAPLPRPGDWQLAGRSDCPETPPAGMVCVPGGVFLLGDPENLRAQPDNALELLVRVSPFALDEDEMTVARYLELAEEFALPLPNPRATDPALLSSYCSYDPDDPESLQLPINCIDFGASEAACRVQGKRLPREAEVEFASGNGTRETRYPWGEDDDVCRYTIVERAPTGLAATVVLGEGSCRDTGSGPLLPPGPVAGGHDNDVTDDGARNLGGNLIEWTNDSFEDYAGDCWPEGADVLEDPMCENDRGIVAVRGGGWGSPPAGARAYWRNGNLKAALRNPEYGFRCAIGYGPSE